MLLNIKKCASSVIVGFVGILLFTIVTVAMPAEERPGIEQVNVFVSGEDSVHTYRIPSLIITPKGTLLAFCEARKQSISDASPTDIVLKRSTNGGITWSAMQILIRGKDSEAIMNPTVVFDSMTNTIFLFCVNAHRIKSKHHCHLLITSRDDGKTWSDPVDITDRIIPYDDTFVSGPGIGIQMVNGRLIIPGYTGEFDEESRTGTYSKVLYSDNHGETWIMGENVSAFSNESQVVELADGTLMLNWRDVTGQSCRGTAISQNGGATWSEPVYARALNECPCQASFIRYTLARTNDKNRLLFSNPNVSGHRYGVVKRTRMTVRLSYDEGKTWPVSRLIHGGPSSYSCLVALPDGDIGLIYEGGKEHRREWIRFARFTLQWLSGGKDRLPNRY